MPGSKLAPGSNLKGGLQMPELDFQIIGVEPETNGIIPLQKFKLQVHAAAGDAPVQAILLHAQIQIQSPRRTYRPAEKEKLLDLFGTPERWGQTLRNRLWTHAQTNVGPFSGSTEATLLVPCSYDLNLAAHKYFYALEEGNIPLLFLFTGTYFYSASDGRLQVGQIAWDKESSFELPVQLWRDLMEHHYPNSAWLTLSCGVFERVYAYKRRRGLATWDEALENLLNASGTGVDARERVPTSVGLPGSSETDSSASGSLTAKEILHA